MDYQKKTYLIIQRINHLNLEQKIGLKQMINHEEHIIIKKKILKTLNLNKNDKVKVMLL